MPRLEGSLHGLEADPSARADNQDCRHGVILADPPGSPVMCDVGRRTASGRAARFRSSNQTNLSFSYPAACLSGTAPDQFEQAVAGADHRPSASRISGRVPPTPGVDNAEKDGALWKPFGIGGQQVGGRLRIADRRIGEQVDRGYAGRHLLQHRPHLTRIGAGNPKSVNSTIMFSACPSAPAPCTDFALPGIELWARLRVLRRKSGTTEG